MSEDPVLHALGGTMAALWSQVTELKDALEAVGSANQALTDEVAALRDQLTRAGRANAAMAGELDGLRHRVDHQPVTADSTRRSALALLWLANTPLRARPLVTVIVPTFTAARRDLLRGAVESVVAQTYTNWELVVVDNSDDGVVDDVRPEWPDDPRIHVIRTNPRSASMARNAGLDRAEGELIGYLDDDCRWFPWWLHAAVAAFEATPESAFVHGVRFSGGADFRPAFVQASTVTPLSLHLDNTVDTNALVHRSNLDQRWDPDLHACSDYDLVVRLAELPHRFVPVPACTYGLDTPEQVWAADNLDDNLAQRNAIRARARARRPLRIVAFNPLYPLLSEAYIGDELEALRRCGADVVLARDTSGPVACPSRVDAPLYDSIEEAFSVHDPDLVLCHWIDTAMTVRGFAAEHGVPHAVRLHSICETASNEEVFHDWCIGAWGPPHVDRNHPRSFPLPTLIIDPEPPGRDDGRTQTVVMACAGLPKKNWPAVVEAVAPLGVPLHFAIGRTSGFDDQPDEVRRLMAEADALGSVAVDVDHDTCQEMIRSAGALLYSLVPGHPLGQPRSVLEGAIAGTPLVVPEAPAFRSMLGDIAHYYERGDVASLRGAVTDALTDPHPEAARLDLSLRLRERHGSDATFDHWYHSVIHALLEWQERRQSDDLWSERHWWSGGGGI